MRIRKGSAGTKDPAAANWDRVFGGGIHDASLATASDGSPVTTGRSGTASQYRGSTPSPTPAELDPEDGA